MNRENRVGTILSFALGAAAGAITALLLAPNPERNLEAKLQKA